MTPEMIGILGVIVLLVLIALKIPIAYSMFAVGFVGFAILVSPSAALNMVSTEIFSNFSSYTLSVIPMFVWMGFIAYYSGVGTSLYAMAHKLVGRLPGGLAIATQAACAVFGAICGSNTATAATMGAIALPEMRKYGYDDSLSTASVAAAGALGVLIPPSVIFIVYGVATEQSIGALFISGIVSGLLLMLFYMVTIFILVKRNPSLAPYSPQESSIGSKGFLKSGIPEVLITFLISLGGLFAGWFTPTEGGAVGCFGAIIIGVARGKLKWPAFKQALWDTISTSTMVILLVASAVVLGRFLTAAYLPSALAEWVTSINAPNLAVLLVIIIVYVLGGMFSDALGFLTLSVPVFFPLAEALGYNIVWFAVLVTVVTTFGAISPPVGVNLYVVKNLRPDIPIATIMKGAMWFVPAYILVIVLLIAIPQLITAVVSAA